jgi:hypothetical protein
VNHAGRVIEEAPAERSSRRIAPVPAVLVVLSVALSLVRAAEPVRTAALASGSVPRETAFCVTDGQTTVLCARFLDEHGTYRTDTVTGFPADSNWGEPSIAVSAEDVAHVCWNQAGRIVYSVKQPGMNWWGPFHVSMPMCEPAGHPRVELINDRVVCTWCGPKVDHSPGGIWQSWSSAAGRFTDWSVPEYLGDSTQVELMRDK